MPSTLPSVQDCCVETCECPATVNIPGPSGENGTNGTPGENGINAFTTIVTAAFLMPAEGASAVANVASTEWMGVNQIIYAAKTDGTVVGYLQVMAIGGATVVTLKNLEDTASSAYLANSAPGSIFTTGSTVSPAGLQGPGTTASGAAGGDLKGTYPNPLIAVNNAKGALLVGNGTDSVSVPAGTNGHMVAYDSTDAEGIKSFAALPLTGGTDVLDNRVARLDGTTGLPIPMQSSKVTITDDGAIRADGSTLGILGNARGTEAIDLQVRRTANTMVASGTNSTIGGGSSNTASGVTSTVGGGSANVASGLVSSVSGGTTNTASALTSAVGAGISNIARSESSYVGGGDGNIAGDAGAANARCTVGGGDRNQATGQESTIAGGNQNQATGTQSTVGGGDSNEATAEESFIGGGNDNLASGTLTAICGGGGNTASATGACIPGGHYALADKYGQLAWSGCGLFAAQGDAQSSWLMLRRATTDATASALFVDGVSLRATIASGKSWMFQIMLVARKSDGLTSIYKSEGVISNVAGTTTLPAAATTTEIFDGIGLPATPVVITADDANDSLIITVTGIAATNIRWVARVAIVEVIY